MPGDAQNPSEAAQAEGVESALLTRVEGPGLATVEQRAQHAGLVYLHLGADGSCSVILETHFGKVWRQSVTMLARYDVISCMWSSHFF